jgi:hypothetical protein
LTAGNGLGKEDRAVRDALASQILSLVTETPTITVTRVAEVLGVAPTLAGEVIDSYLVTAGIPTWVGRGQGGGWIPEDIRMTLVTGNSQNPTQIGYRWPDGSLHEHPYEEVIQ